MSLRIGLYDFFSYTLPGVFFIIITVLGLTTFGVINLDPAVLADLSLSSLLILTGTGYLIGLLLDPIAERWVRLFIGTHHQARDKAFAEFHSRHPKLKIEFAACEWDMLFYAVKAKSAETATDVELHNVATIMLRSISLVLLIAAVLFLLIFIFALNNIWTLVVAITMPVLSGIAINVCRLRRRWFYKGIFEAFAVYYLLEEKIKSPAEKDHLPQAAEPMEIPPTVESTEEKQQTHEN